MSFKLFSILLLTFTIISCNEKKIYDKLDKDFIKNRWQKSDLKTFEFNIEEEARNYDVKLHFAYFSEFVVDSVPLLVTILHPNKTEEQKEINIVVKDKNGKETGDCGGDFCDIRAVIFKNQELKKGTYKITIQQNFDGQYLPNVNGIGIEVIAQVD